MQIQIRETSFNGHQWWYRDGWRHREDGPAIVMGKYQAWVRRGLYHRLDGPARINTSPDLGPQYWVAGVQIEPSDYPAAVRGYLAQYPEEHPEEHPER